MFATALKTAMRFTHPVITSVRRRDGKCGAVIGTFVALNDDGWVLTAGHIVRQMKDFVTSAQNCSNYDAQVAAIQANKTLTPKQRQKAILALGKIAKDGIAGHSTYWGFPGVIATAAFGNEPADIAVVKLKGLPTLPAYPVIKDPTKDYDPGTSLCRLGFPFHEIEPTYDPNKNQFTLPPGALPVPFFPIEGILTRFVDVTPVGAAQAPYPLRMVETSSPGLLGQSGGPIIDRHGGVWGIQSSTRHLPLGFNPLGPNGKPLGIPPQFLHVGWGTHTETIIGLLNQHGVKFSLSTY
jgi:hypothetical protein